MILIYMMVLCTQVNKMYVFFKLARCGHTLRVAITYVIILYNINSFINLEQTLPVSVVQLNSNKTIRSFTADN